MKARALWRLPRMVNAAMSAAAVVLAAYVAVGPGFPAIPTVAGALAAAFIAAAGNVANDAVDAAIDARAHPRRAIPRGDATRREAWTYSAVLAVAGLASATVAGAPAFALAAGALFLLAAYEWRLKTQGFPGNVVVASLTGAPFIMGGLVVDAVTPVILAFALVASLANLGRELVKDLEDADADVGRLTLPRRGHPRLAEGLAVGAFVTAVVLSPLPFIIRSENALSAIYVPLVSLADFGFILAAWNVRRPHRASGFAKVAMLLAMVAFFVGRMTTDVMM